MLALLYIKSLQNRISLLQAIKVRGTFFFLSGEYIFGVNLNCTMTKVMCNFCNKTFANLKSHQKNKHPSEVVRQLCPLCPPEHSNSVFNESELQLHYEKQHPTATVQTETKKVRVTSLEQLSLAE